MFRNLQEKKRLRWIHFNKKTSLKILKNEDKTKNLLLCKSYKDVIKKLFIPFWQIIKVVLQYLSSAP